MFCHKSRIFTPKKLSLSYAEQVVVHHNIGAPCPTERLRQRGCSPLCVSRWPSVGNGYCSRPLCCGEDCRRQGFCKGFPFATDGLPAACRDSLVECSWRLAAPRRRGNRRSHAVSTPSRFSRLHHVVAFCGVARHAVASSCPRGVPQASNVQAKARRGFPAHSFRVVARSFQWCLWSGRLCGVALCSGEGQCHSDSIRQQRKGDNVAIQSSTA